MPPFSAGSGFEVPVVVSAARVGPFHADSVAAVQNRNSPQSSAGSSRSPVASFLVSGGRVMLSLRRLTASSGLSAV